MAKVSTTLQRWTSWVWCCSAPAIWDWSFGMAEVPRAASPNGSNSSLRTRFGASAREYRRPVGRDEKMSGVLFLRKWVNAIWQSVMRDILLWITTAAYILTSFQFSNLFCAKSSSLTELHFFFKSSGGPAWSIPQSLSTSTCGTLHGALIIVEVA